MMGVAYILSGLHALRQRIDRWGQGSISPAFKLRVVDSFKPALSMSIVIGLAFYLDFKQPYWAAFAVLMMSFSTTGQAFRRAFVGIPGTLVGGVVALIMTSIFPQEPIFLLPVLIIYCGITMYFLQACKVNGYFFFTIAFVCLVVITSAIPISDNVFEYAMARLEETCLGMTVYSAVTLLFWRRSALPVLQEKVAALTSLHAELFAAQMKRVATKERAESFQLLRIMLRTLDTVEELVGFAVTDSFEVWQNRASWHEFVQHSRELLRAQLRWGWIIPELRKEYMQQTLPDLAQRIRQLEVRLAAMKQGSHADHLRTIANAVHISRDEEVFASLSHFKKAQVVVVESAFNEIGRLVHALMHYHCFFHDTTLPRPKRFLKPPKWVLPLDFDYVVYATQSIFTFFVVAILWYFYFPPGANTGQFLQLGGAFALIAIFVSSREPLAYGLSYVWAALIVIVLYLVTIQNVTSYLQLGMIIFAVTFGVYFLLTKERHAPLKLGLMLAWLAFPKFANQQTFDFAYVLNGAVAMMLAGLTAGYGMYFTAYPLPERRFLRERKRFFASAIYMIKTLPEAVSGKLSWLERLRLKACLQNCSRIPQKLLGVVEKLDKEQTDVSRERLERIVFSFDLLGEALLSLHQIHRKGHNVRIIEEMSPLLTEWQQKKLEAFTALRDSIASPEFDSAMLRKNIERRMEWTEEQVQQVVNNAEKEGHEISIEDSELLYKIVDRNRGLANAMLEYLIESSTVKWEAWGEPRF